MEAVFGGAGRNSGDRRLGRVDPDEVVVVQANMIVTDEWYAAK